MLRDVLLRQFLRLLLDNLAQYLAQLFFEPGMEDRIDRRDPTRFQERYSIIVARGARP
jgi:hypothetical protein